MNILASYNWIKEYLDTDLAAEDFAREMSLKSMSVEQIMRQREIYSGVVVGEMLEITKHPDADKLNLAKVDIGQSEPLNLIFGQVVDMKVGDKVPVAVAPTTLPGGVKIEKRKMRGEVSEGMLCLDEELGWEKSDTEIRFFDAEVKNGTPLVEALDIDDEIFDIEVTSNRVDSMSIVGLAREAAVATDGQFNFDPPKLPSTSKTSDLKITVEESELCPRYMAVVIDGIKVGPSPEWLRKKILLSGHRPINNIVDITNYILHEYGQPLHAFDFDKLRGGEIIVRRAGRKEKFLALDENEYELSPDNLVIADREGAVAVAGVMGGQHSGTWDGTTKIVFEAATFEPIGVRRTSRALNLYSDSQLLFEKGLSTESPAAALARAVELTLEIAGGEVASEVYDVRAERYRPLTFPFDPARCRAMLGVDLATDEMIKILEQLGFKVNPHETKYQVEVPYWRDHDIEDEIDFTEEVARLYGYHNLPSVLPQSPPPADIEDKTLHWEDWLKKICSASGYSEFYSYSFVSADDLSRYDLEPAQAVKVFNPLSSDLTHLRPSLMPSLMRNVELNQGEVPQARVFELARVYLKQKNDLPEERTHLVLAEFGQDDVESAFLRLKGVLEMIAEKSGLNLSFEREHEDAHWHPTRSAKIVINGDAQGVLGQVDLQYQSAFGIDRPVVVAELDLANVIPLMHEARRFTPIPEFPAIVRDVAVVIDEAQEYQTIASAIKKQSPIIEAVGLVDVYRGSGIPDHHKSVTLSITLRAPDKTLSSEHADDVMKVVEKVLREEFGGVLR